MATALTGIGCADEVPGTSEHTSAQQGLNLCWENFISSYSLSLKDGYLAETHLNAHQPAGVQC